MSGAAFRPRRGCVLASSLAAAVLAVAVATSAPVAAREPGAAGSGLPSFTHPLPQLDHHDQTWGGYAVTGDTPYTSITGGWNVPVLDCSEGNGYVSPWIGIDGWADRTVEQIGIDMDCRSGAAVYRPWVEMYPKGSHYFSKPVEAGDTMTAAVSVNGTAWTLSETDSTQDWTKTFTFESSDQLESAEAILEDLGRKGAPPVDDFGTVTFTKLQVNGQDFASAGTAHKTTLRRRHLKLSHESRLKPEHYSITWLHR